MCSSTFQIIKDRNGNCGHPVFINTTVFIICLCLIFIQLLTLSGLHHKIHKWRMSTALSKSRVMEKNNSASDSWKLLWKFVSGPWVKQQFVILRGINAATIYCLTSAGSGQWDQHKFLHICLSSDSTYEMLDSELLRCQMEHLSIAEKARLAVFHCRQSLC